MNQPQRHYSELHGLRGLAALGVFAAHATYGLAQQFDCTDCVKIICHAIHNVGTFGVEVFFMLSGFLIAGSCQRYTAINFALLRSSRILPLYFFTTGLYYLVNHIKSFEPENQTVASVLANITFTQYLFRENVVNPSAWSVVHEVWYYVLCFALTRYALADQRKTTYRICGLCLMALFSAAYTVAFPVSLYFVTGCAIYHLRDRMPLWLTNRDIIPVVSSLALILVVAIWKPKAKFFEFDPIMTPAAMALSGILLTASAKPSTVAVRMLNLPTLAYLGKISFSLYLTAPFVYFAFKIMISRHIIQFAGQAIGGVLYLVLITGLSLAIAHAAWYLFEFRIYNSLKIRMNDAA